MPSRDNPLGPEALADLADELEADRSWPHHRVQAVATGARHLASALERVEHLVAEVVGISTAIGPHRYLLDLISDDNDLVIELAGRRLVDLGRFSGSELATLEAHLARIAAAAHLFHTGLQGQIDSQLNRGDELLELARRLSLYAILNKEELTKPQIVYKIKDIKDDQPIGSRIERLDLPEPSIPHWPSIVPRLKDAAVAGNLEPMLDEELPRYRQMHHERIRALGELAAQHQAAIDADAARDLAVLAARESEATWSDVGRAVGLDPIAAQRRWDRQARLRHNKNRRTRTSPGDTADE